MFELKNTLKIIHYFNQNYSKIICILKINSVTHETKGTSKLRTYGERILTCSPVDSNI